MADPRGQIRAHLQQHRFRADLDQSASYTVQNVHPVGTQAFPALSPSERLHLELFGCLVLPNVLSMEEVDALKTDILNIEEAYRRTGDMELSRDPNGYSWCIFCFRFFIISSFYRCFQCSMLSLHLLRS